MSVFNTGQATAQLKLEFMGGDDLEACCREAVRIAKILGCMTRFEANGVHFMAKPTTDPAALFQSYQYAITSGHAYKVAA